MDRLPDYRCAAYSAKEPLWRYLEDVYEGVSAWTTLSADGKLQVTPKSRRYLPQEPNEKDEFYLNRLIRSPFSDQFSRAVRDFVGIILNNGLQLVDVPRQIEAQWPVLGRGGIPGSLFVSRAALHSLRLGHSFVLVDFPPRDDSIQSLDQLGDRHPFWSSFSALQLIDWDYETRSNEDVLTRAVLCYTKPVRTPKGEELKPFYLELLPGLYRIWSVDKVPHSDQRVAVLHAWGAMGRRVRGRFQPFDRIPLVCLYGGDSDGFFSSRPTLRSLADLNVSHYQVKSDHRQKMHTCCFPQPTRVGGTGGAITLGYTVAVDVPVGGAFLFTEPNSNSLAMSRVEVQDIEAEIDLLSADYLAKPGDRQAAQTSVIAATKIESKLFLFAQDFAQGLTECLNWHARYLGLPSGGRVVLKTKFFDQVASDPQLLLALLRAGELGVLTGKEVKEIATKKRFFGDDN